MSTETRRAIVEAAVAEFSDHGFDGTRIESVARRAGCNKALVYRYYGDKTGLFEAALRSKFEGRTQILESLPESLAEIMSHWFRTTSDDPHFMRLIQHEALADDGGEVVEQDYRRNYYRRQIELLAHFQQEGLVTDELETRYLFLALLSLIVYPTSFPQITRLATGQTVDGRAFRRGYARFLSGLAEQLAK